MKNGESYLSQSGKKIYSEIYNSVKEKGVFDKIYSFELSMLANSLALYAQNAKHCNQNGIHQTVGEKGYKQVSPEYTVMKNEYSNILKHSPKFGLNPSDMEKLIKIAEDSNKRKNEIEEEDDPIENLS